MIPGKQYTPELVLSIAWRRKWLILIPSVVVATIACAVTYSLPDLYRSEMTILVVPQRVPENYVRSTVNTKVEERLRSINQQVRSRTKLERIIDDFSLYTERRKRDIMQDIVDDMSNNIGVEIVQGDVFRISFLSDKPRDAMRVTERLGTFFVDESLKDRTALAENASEFLDTQVADAARKLRDTEQKLAEYKRKYDGELPTQVSNNQQGLFAMQAQLQNVVRQIDLDRERQLTLEKSIADLTEAAEAAAASPVTEQDPGVSPLSAAGQLAAKRAQLAALLKTRNRGFPDVDKLDREIAELEEKATQEAARQTPLGSPVVATSSLAVRRLRDLEDARTSLRKLERQIENELADQRMYSRKIAEYQKNTELAPLRETELVELTRDYGIVQQQYSSLAQKKADSQLSANLERRQIGEQFKILDPARLPEKPFSPNRQRLYLMSIFFGILLGVGSAAVAEYMDRGLRSEDDVRLALALPVLATIPVIGNEKKGLSKRWKLLAGSAAVVVMAAVAGAAWFVLR